jgi:crotonobetainyl-CoA:carnitine CoA-transferase CaiB-like acyl-CoA transferase
MGGNYKGMLNEYRVLDLTDEKGFMCGKLLGDLGADVIKIEKPGGDPARNIKPFFHDEPGPEKSLLWLSFNTSKRGITLDITKSKGQEIFKSLVKTADFIVESFPPGYMDSLGLGYSELQKINPSVIMVSISPFGQTGPYKDFEAPDIVLWALGGYLYATGESDRPPLRISHPCQSYLHAGADGAIAAMLALHQRYLTGKSQLIDIAIRDSLTATSWAFTSFWDMTQIDRQRGGQSATTTIKNSICWPCKDGHVIWMFLSGSLGVMANPHLMSFMESEGKLPAILKNYDWTKFNLLAGGGITQEDVDRLREPIGKFFMEYTKKELFERGMKHLCSIYPLASTQDIIDSPQLAARGFWQQIEHPELGATLSYPGAFVTTSESPPSISRKAPLIGEHNNEIYMEELGFSHKDLDEFKKFVII